MQEAEISFLSDRERSPDIQKEVGAESLLLLIGRCQAHTTGDAVGIMCPIWFWEDSGIPPGRAGGHGHRTWTTIPPMPHSLTG